jgi:hypothetical protein
MYTFHPVDSFPTGMCLHSHQAPRKLLHHREAHKHNCLLYKIHLPHNFLSGMYYRSHQAPRKRLHYRQAYKEHTYPNYKFDCQDNSRIHWHCRTHPVRKHSHYTLFPLHRRIAQMNYKFDQKDRR